ncbi:hypothetical protein [Streptomyces bluensis]|uniref:Uncharacterized protein n=1 Tax=Streptomyces bluensis TaxID=33897 RepID=A0ABW6UTZ7_9ACTN
MTTMTIAPGNTGDEQPKTSYDQGLIDGELAALTKLPARRAIARAAMAEQYDPLYAQGYSDGYLAGIQRNYAYAQKESTR